MGRQQVLSSFFAKKPAASGGASGGASSSDVSPSASPPVDPGESRKRKAGGAEPPSKRPRPAPEAEAAAAAAASSAAASSSAARPARLEPRGPDCFDHLRPDPVRQAQFGAALERMHEERERREAPAPTAGASGGQYTPLEKQVLALKQKHPGVLLAVEVGYKFMFYGDDAKAAAEALSIVAYPKNHMIQAGVPTDRLKIHLRRLVEAGHKVGVVRQTETAALKKASSTRSKMFSRALTEIFTKSTLVDELAMESSGNEAEVREPAPLRPVDIRVRRASVCLHLGLSKGAGGVGSQRHHSKLPELTSYLLCLCESTLSAPAAASPGAGGAPPPQVRVSMVAVDAATASVVHDCFEVHPSLSLPAQLARAPNIWRANTK